MKEIKVIGIGNLIMQDDGLGVHIIRELEAQGVPGNVELIDGGTHSYDLLEFLADADYAIIVDAMHTGGEPGTIYRAPLDELGIKPQENMTSLHELHFVEAVEMARLLGYHPQVLVFGVEPKEVGLGLELTPEVAARVPRVAQLIQEEIKKIALEAEPENR